MSWPMDERNSEVRRPIRNLRCCCCGGSTLGRQWWNRDAGYGLCNDCIHVNGVSQVANGETVSGFGIRGVHWDLKTKTKNESPLLR